MRLASKIPLVTAIMVSLTSAAVASTALTISYQQGLDALEQDLQSFSEVVQTESDPLSAAIFLATEKPFTLIHIQEDGTRTLLQEKAGLESNPNLVSSEIALGFGERLIVAVDSSHLNSLVRDSLLPVIAFTALLVLLGSMLSWLVLRRDTTALRALALAAAKADGSNELQLPDISNTKELKELAQSLNQLLRRIEESRRELEDFLSDTSHELKTPLTVIRGYLELVDKAPAGPATQKAIRSALREALRMQSILSGLLELSSISSANPARNERFDAMDVLRIEVENLSVVNPARAIELQGPESAYIETDPLVFRALIGNVFSNIRNHTPNNSAVSIRVKKSAANLEIKISDSGPGLPAELLTQNPELPIRFRTSQKPGSSGLGLNIMHKAAQSLGAKLEISNQADAGATVKIVI
ncbi:MAG: sensor histidine kinase [Actinobacteria bacterium]|nr:sensor histidine kinase [Actinomycetota bacterium]